MIDDPKKNDPKTVTEREKRAVRFTWNDDDIAITKRVIDPPDDEMKRTFLTDRLRIAVVKAGPEFGRIGITFCPGKFDPNAQSGYWDRDLALDLDEVRAWGAAVITLLEQTELTLLQVERLGEEVQQRNIRWLHLPIVDISIPDGRFEQKWATVGAELRSILRHGSDVLVHCRGGLGRAGLIAARLLIELGVEPSKAIANVRAVRPGAIQTLEQEKFVLSICAMRECDLRSDHGLV